MELTGPSTHMSNAMARATARGPNLPQPLHASTGVSLWQEPLCKAACELRPVLAWQGLAGHQGSTRHRDKNRKLHTAEAQILWTTDALLATLTKTRQDSSMQLVCIYQHHLQGS